jgi:hypothetical protein
VLHGLRLDLKWTASDLTAQRAACGWPVDAADVALRAGPTLSGCPSTSQVVQPSVEVHWPSVVTYAPGNCAGGARQQVLHKHRVGHISKVGGRPSLPYPRVTGHSIAFVNSRLRT